MSEERMSRKELHQPDRVEVWLYSAVNYMYKKRQWFITGGIAVIVVAAGILLGMNYYQNEQIKQAELLYTAQKELLEVTDTNADGQRRAIEAFKDFLSTYPDGSNSTIAWMHLGELHAKQQDWGNAEKAYQNVINGKNVPQVMATSAKLSLAALYENQKKWDEASRTISQIQGDDWRDLQWKSLARIELAQGKTSEARSHLEQLVKETPESPFKQEAESLLLTLNQ